MESLTGHLTSEPFEARDSPQIDRVVLGREQSDLVNKWVRELNERADGLIRFTKTDVVNFMLAHHGAQFSTDETRAIANQCFDEAKWLSWSVTKIKAGRKSGEKVSFDDLMKFRDELLSGDMGMSAPRVTKRRRTIRRLDEGETTEASETSVATDPPE